MYKAARQAILKIGTDAYEKGISDTYETVIFAINENSGQMTGWTPEMYVMFIKEVQQATLRGFNTALKKNSEEYGQ